MSTFKVATLCGSLRKGSYNAMIARALPELAPPGMEVGEPLSFRDFPLYDADIQAEGFPDSVTAMGAAIKSADAVAVVSPEYNYSVPGGLKNAIDWLSRLSPQPFEKKPVVILSASMGVLGGARMQYHLRQIFVFLNSHVMPRPETMVGQAQKKVDETSLTLTDKETREFIGKQLAAFADYARKVDGP
jgi:chromate reductase